MTSGTRLSALPAPAGEGGVITNRSGDTTRPRRCSVSLSTDAGAVDVEQSKRGTAMGDADEAWREWGGAKGFADYDHRCAAFLAGFAAGQVAALEDAAEEIHTNGDSWAITENVKPDVRDVVSNVLWGTADYVRARAVAAKDGSEG